MRPYRIVLARHPLLVKVGIGDRRTAADALSFDDLQYYEARFFLVPGPATHYIDAKLSVVRQRRVGASFEEQLTVLNYDETPIDIQLRIDASSDFADLFEIKNETLDKKGEAYARADNGRLILGYQRRRFRSSRTRPTTVRSMPRRCS